VPYLVDRLGATEAMLRLMRRLVRHEHLFYELIYSHWSYSIKNGLRVPRYAINQHWDHIHIAVDRGVFLAAPQRTEVVIVPDSQLPRIQGPVEFHPVIDTTNGQCTGYYIFSPSTGEVHSWGPGAPFHGRSEAVREPAPS
jgi:hypothetical protein